MAASTEERNRILHLVESGQITAAEAAQLLDTLGIDRERLRDRMVRVRVTDLTSNRQKINVTIPIGLINIGLRLGARLAPQLNEHMLDDLFATIETGKIGRLLDLHDMEEGERIEVFVE